MTQEDFKRIVTAVCQMRSYNLPDGIFVPYEGVMAVIYTQLSPEDQKNWSYNRETRTWTHVG